MPESLKVLIKTDDFPKLTFDLEKRMMDFVVEELAACRKSMGWMGSGAYEDHMRVRHEASNEYEGDFKHRMNADRFGPLFQIYNFSENMPRGVVELSKSRTGEQLLDGEKFASMIPDGEANQTPALKAMDEHLSNQLDEGNAQDAYREGIQAAAVTGEGIIKVSKMVDAFSGKKTGEVWMAPDESGNPSVMMDSKGEPIWHDDTWEQHPNDLNGEVLQKDPSIVKPPGAQLSPKKITRPVNREKDMLFIENVSWRDFFCRLTEPSIQKAISCHQTFTWTYDKIWKFLDGNNLKLTEEQKAWKENLRKGTAPAPEDSKLERQHLNEKRDGVPPQVNEWAMCESWYCFDPMDDGNTVELYCFWEINSKMPLIFLPMEKASDCEERPYNILRTKPRQDRWTGFGWYEWLAMDHLCIDRSRNRIEVRDGSGGRIDLIKPKAFPQLLRGKPFRPGAPGAWEVADDYKLEEAFKFIELPAVNENVWKLMEHDLQRSRTLSGTMMPSEQTGTPSGAKNNTATFVNQQAGESETLSSEHIRDVSKGVIASLQQAAMTIFKDFNYQDAAEHLGMEKAKLIQEWLSQNPVKRLMHHVRLLMAKMRNQRQLQANHQAWELYKEWVELVTTSPAMALKAKPMMKQMFTSLDIQGVEEMFDINQILKAQQQQAQMEAQSQQPPPNAPV